MRGRLFAPRHLDVEALAERAEVLSGSLPLGGFARLVEMAHPEAPPESTDMVSWQATGERRAVRGSGRQTWLHLLANGHIRLTCQRCLQAVDVPLDLRRSYRFVADEASAAEADLEAEEDLLVVTHALDLPALIEDEFLLALPLVPRHEGECPQPLLAASDVNELAAASGPRENPFDVLAGLKARKAVN